ncbi:TetR/AcrR family transcriptional regulator [Streptomyces sp. NPDC090306]|uniref:TetR/AcrR family transcriptional regulator n=1 Tax=Streptomyces sp. NPDC090306 TaxID=3365961 RepID=UPI0037F1FF4C
MNDSNPSEPTPPAGPAPGPLRRRGAAMRAAVLDAAGRVLVAEGLAGTTMAAVAREAGVHETSLYRRWGTREKLIQDALREIGDEAAPLPDTGSVRDDLVLHLAAVDTFFRTPRGGALLRLGVGLPADDALAGRRTPYWEARLERTAALVRRGVERGELAPGTDPLILTEALCGPVLVRILLSAAPPDPALPARLVDAVLDGHGADD